MIPMFLTNFVLPFALSIIRSYLYNPSNSMDGQLLDTVKQSISYLAVQDNNNVSFGHIASMGQTQMIPPQSEGV